MNYKNSKNKNLSNFGRWLLIMLVALVMPLLVLFVAKSYIMSVRSSLALRDYQIRASALLEELRVSSDSGLYICSRINDEFKSSSDHTALMQRMHMLNPEFDNMLSFLVWDEKGNVIDSTFDYQDIQANWQHAFFSLLGFSRNRNLYADPDATANLRLIFGPQFFPDQHQNCYSGKNIKPIYADSSLRRPLAWVRVGKTFGMLVFFPEKLVKGIPGVKANISKTSRNTDFNLAVMVDDLVIADDAIDIAPEIIAESRSNFVNPQKIGNWYVFKSLLGNRLHGFCFLPAKKIQGFILTPVWVAVIFFVAVCFVSFAWRSFQVFCCGLHLNLSIRRQLIVLFVISNAMSLLILGLLGYDYLHQYRLQLQQDAFNESTRYLQSVDDMFVSEFSIQLHRMDTALQEMKESLQKGLFNKAMIEEFIDKQKHVPFRFFLIGSHTPMIASELGIIRDGKLIENIDMDWSRYKSLTSLVEAMGKLGAYYLAMLNKESLAQGIQVQVELIAESFGQLRPIELFQEFYASTGSFWQWGMGMRYYPAYNNVFYLFDKNVADYVFLYLYKPVMLQRNYIRRIFQNINRNSAGIKVMSVDEDFRFSFPEELLKHQQLRKFALKLRERTAMEIEFCRWQDEKYLLSGLKCSSLDSQRLVGLYPVSIIEEKVKIKFRLLTIFAIVSVLVSVALGLFVARSVLRPLAELKHGIIALEKREFTHRLPDLGHDEFGHLAKIFNDTLVDLEELHVAATFQEKLMNKPHTVEEIGKYKVFASNISSGKPGGNLLERIGEDDESFRMLLGDVGGRGIARSLTLAFVRTAIERLYCGQSGVELLADLKKIIQSSNRSEQSESMTMQLVTISASQKELEVVDAGHCVPLLLDQNNQSSITLPVDPFASGIDSEVVLFKTELKDCQALVFYSPGLEVAFRGQTANLQEILLTCYAADPQKFFVNIETRLLESLNGEKPEQDISIVIISPAGKVI